MEIALAALVLVGWYILYRILDRIIRIPLIGALDIRYILVTGCDTGFGNAVTKKLDKMGCHVFAGCLTETGETDLKKTCSDRVRPIRMNVSDPQSVRKVYAQVKDALPAGKGLWGVLNNAGISGKTGPFDWLSLDDYKKVLDVNTYGLVDVTTTFLPLLKKSRGRIVNTASVFGRFTIPGCVAYNMSKYSVEAFSDCVRREMKPWGVTAHIIEPGFHKTNITDAKNLINALQKSYSEAPREVRDQYGQEFVDKSGEVVIQQFVSGIITEDIGGVVDAYTHALLGRYPRARYVIGNDAKFLWIPLSYAPEWLADYIMDKAAKDKPLPAALKN